ncbi:MAG: L-2-hydroxyglutarate oxidase [Armatimonadetes bacterium]|nr:L-2-hydroxyglutarate oxidase [Armatimonadota bacterium]
MARQGADTADFVVIGGGVIGLNIACELKRRCGDSSVLLLEKENAVGEHASGRNSGVLHAGFYYTADSLKARFTRQGNEAVRAYCQERSLPINRCGKLVVARDESELAGIAELLRRGRANGVPLEEISEARAREIEPRVKTCGKALWSPTTATVDPKAVMAALLADAEALGVRVALDCGYRGRRGRSLLTRRGTCEAGYVVNAAGLYADRIARDFGFGGDYEILPFKGLYLYSSEREGALRTNVYPVPNLKNPFLGVHFTLTVDGHVKIGPTAIPCLWREQYDWTRRFRAGELAAIAGAMAGLFFRAGFDFRSLAVEEMRKYRRAYLVRQAAVLAEGVRLEDYTHWGRPGIRAQLVRKADRTLVMDFCLEGDERSFHVLNAVSPAFTCAIPFSHFVCDEIERAARGRSVPRLAAGHRA